MLKKTLQSPLDNPEYSLERLMLKLKLQCFGHQMQRADSLEKTLMLGNIDGRRKRGWQRMRWFDGITDLTDISLSKLQEMVKDREAWHAAIQGSQRVGHDLATKWQLPRILARVIWYNIKFLEPLDIVKTMTLRHYYNYFTSNISVQIQKEMYLNHICHLLAL